MLGKSAKKGSDNPQITITDLAHWYWQSGVIYQKPSYLLRRLNKGAKPHPGIGSKEDPVRIVQGTHTGEVKHHTKESKGGETDILGLMMSIQAYTKFLRNPATTAPWK